MRAERIRLLPDSTSQTEAREKVFEPGDVSLIVRGRIRWIVMKCPDGCDDTITLNADDRAGPAWRIFRRKGLLTLHPSVWRTEGCRSHFIVWRGRIQWFGTSWWDQEVDDSTLQLVLASLGPVPIGYWEVADAYDLLPWDVLLACQQLQRRGLVAEQPKDSGRFTRLG